jgi:cell division topological specificity factor
MSVFAFFRHRESAPIARERLQILLSYDRSERGKPDLLAVLREEILTVIARHVTIDKDKLQVRIDRGVGVSTLGVDVEIPHSLGSTGGLSLKGASSEVPTTHRL